MIEYSHADPAQLLHGLLDLNNAIYIQKGYIIKFIESYDTVRYHPTLEPSEHVVFLENKKVLWNCLISLLDICPKNFVWIIPYDSQWKAGISFDYNKLVDRQMIIKTNEYAVIEEIFDMSLKYYSFPVFMSCERDIAVIPTDHLDLFVACDKEFNISQYVTSPYLKIAEWVNQPDGNILIYCGDARKRGIKLTGNEFKSDFCAFRVRAHVPSRKIFRAEIKAAKDAQLPRKEE